MFTTAVLGDQVVPSGLVKSWLYADVVTANAPLPQVTLYKKLVVPDVLAVQVVPSGLVRITPESPAAQKSEPLHARPLSWLVVPDEREVHVTPVGLVKILPEEPTAQKTVPFQARAFIVVVIPVPAVQVDRFVL
jgi:hypothetical protein